MTSKSQFTRGILAALCMMTGLACDTVSNDVSINPQGDMTLSGTDTFLDEGSSNSQNDVSNNGSDTDIHSYTTALVVTTDRQTGAYATVNLANHAVTKDIRFIHSDAACHFDPLTDTPFILLRLGSDAVDVLDPDSFSIVKEYSVDPSSNPHDIAVISEERAYISRYGVSEMLIVNPMTGERIGEVDLSTYADADGIPEVAGISLLNGKVYVNVERLDRENSWTPVGQSYIVVIDALTGAIEGEVQVTGPNVYGGPVYSEALQKFVLAEAGSFSTLEDGGIEIFDPATNTVSGFVVTETTLGGNVTKGLIISETKGYALVGVAGDNGSNTHVVSFNPQTGEKTQTLLAGDGWIYDDIELTPDRTELWISDRSSENAGIRIFDTTTDTQKTASPISVGLPPSDICFTR